MPLTFSLVGPGIGGEMRETRSLDRGTISIGRGSANDWVLPDPDGQLSRQHCTIANMGGRYILTDLSTNGVFLNGAPDRMPRESQVVLADGDEIRFGPYLIRVSEGGPRAAAGLAPVAAEPAYDPLEDPLGMPPPGFHHPTPIEEPRPRGADPFDIAEDRNGALDPYADRYQGQAADTSWGGAAQRDNLDAAHQFYVPPAVVSNPLLSDDDLDDLLSGINPAATPVANPMAAAARPVTGAAPPPAVPSDVDFDDLLGDLMPPGGAPVPTPSAPPPMPAPTMAPPAVARAPDAMPAPPVAPPMAAPVVAPAPPMPAPVAPPPMAAPPAARNPFDEPAAAAQPPVAAPATAPAPASADAQRLLAAFLAGAGDPRVDLAQQDPEAYFRLMGQLMKLMVENLRDVLMSRAEVKRAFGLEQTMLQARNNNVLKFSVTPEDAVAAILQPSRPGYLPPLRATEEAFADLRSHQLAVMAGVQAALAALLKRFDPATIEARIGSSNRFAALLTGGSKARHWDAFTGLYADIAREAEEDFQAVFGREFAKAYDAQARSKG